MTQTFTSSSPLPAALRHAWLAVTVSLLAGCGGGGTESTAVATAQTNEVAPLPDAVAADVDLGGEVTEAAALRKRRSQAPAPTSAPSPAPSPALTPAPAPASAPAPVSAAATCGLPDFQAALLARINQHRAAGASCRTAGSYAAAAPLLWNASLQQAAAGHSQDMAANNYFSHTSRDGRSMVDRVNATGYGWLTLGENIAAGYPTVDSVIDGWMASDGHCANMMNPNFREVGLACVANPASTYKTYWTMNAGKAR